MGAVVVGVAVVVEGGEVVLVLVVQVAGVVVVWKEE